LWHVPREAKKVFDIRLGLMNGGSPFDFCQNLRARADGSSKLIEGIKNNRFDATLFGIELDDSLEVFSARFRKESLLKTILISDPPSSLFATRGSS
jgi:hypothetical protein